MTKTKKMLARTLNHPTRSFIRAVIELQESQQEARPATLTLSEARALLTHIGRAMRLARWNLQPRAEDENDMVLSSIRDLTLIFERDDVRDEIVSHCGDTDIHIKGRGYQECGKCRYLRLVLAVAISEWRDGCAVSQCEEASKQ